MPEKSQTFFKIGIAAVAAILALLIPLKIISTEMAVHAVKYYSYWLLGGTCVLFLFHLRQPFKSTNIATITTALKKHWPALIIILAATCYLHTHVDRGFKILFDEHVLSSTAMSMHYEQEAFVQTASHNIGDDVITKIGFVDKRPGLFPFATSLVHSLTGYRPENVFWLNSALTCLLLGLIYTVVAKTTSRSHGILALLLVTGLPLFAQNTNGGGYELLNLCLICGLVLAGLHYMKSEGIEGLNLMLMVSILLANNRYESVLYVLVPAALFLLKSYRSKTLMLTWFAALSPLLLIVPLLSYKIFQSYPNFIQTTGDNFFSFEHLPNNLAHAATYLFELTGDYSNSALLSAAGIISMLFLSIQCIRRAPFFIKSDNELTVPFVVFLIVAGNTFLALSCYWGAWTDPATSRFSFPLQLFFVFSVPMALLYDFKLQQPAKWMYAAAALYIIGLSGSHTTRLNVEPRMSVSSGYDWALHWAQVEMPPGNHLILAESAIGFGLLRQATVPFVVANQIPERILKTQEWGLYDDIYAFTVYYLNGRGEKITPRRYRSLNTRFELESVAVQPIKENLYYSIERVVGLKPSTPQNATVPANLPPEVEPTGNLTNYLTSILNLVPATLPTAK